MKKIFIIAAISIFSAVNAYAAGHVGQCVFPKTKPAKNGNLEFKKPIQIYTAPNSTESHTPMHNCRFHPQTVSASVGMVD